MSNENLVSLGLARAVLLVGSAGCAIALGNLFMRRKEYDLSVEKQAFAIMKYSNHSVCWDGKDEECESWVNDIDLMNEIGERLRSQTKRRMWRSFRKFLRGE